MKRIVLVRHGRPAWDFRTPIPGHAFAQWLAGENNAPLDSSSRPGRSLGQLIDGGTCLLASPLRRSRESARALAPSREPIVDACVREAELPSAFRTGLRLRPGAWDFIARVRWLAGWSAGVETFRTARERARHAAALLERQAEVHGTVVLVGHGFMNALIARELRRAGWWGPRLPQRRHWGFGLYQRR